LKYSTERLLPERLLPTMMMTSGGVSRDCSKIGQMILKLRKEKGFTQKEWAEQMNISDRTISKWERG